MGRDREYHKNGSYTDRYGDGTSITRNPDHSVRESVRNESTNPLSNIPGFGDMCDKNIQVTRDSEGRVTDIKPRH